MLQPGKPAISAPLAPAAGSVAPMPVATVAANPPDGPKKEKKPPSLTKKFASKVSTVSSKLTELKCVTTQVTTSELL